MNNKDNVREVRVKTSTEVSRLASSLLEGFQENPDQQIRISTIGAGAINQAVKGVITFNQYLAQRGHIAYFMPYFDVFKGAENSEVTVIKLELKIQKI